MWLVPTYLVVTIPSLERSAAGNSGPDEILGSKASTYLLRCSMPAFGGGNSA